MQINISTVLFVAAIIECLITLAAIVLCLKDFLSHEGARRGEVESTKSVSSQLIQVDIEKTRQEELLEALKKELELGYDLRVANSCILQMNTMHRNIEQLGTYDHRMEHIVDERRGREILYGQEPKFLSAIEEANAAWERPRTVILK